MNESQKGFIFGVAAFILWGLFPLYFKAIGHFTPLEITAYRIIWSFLTLFFYLVFQIRFLETARAIIFEGNFLKLLVSTIFIAINWFLFVYAIDQKHVLQTSFGYFISPILSVMLGVFILNEKITGAKIVALILSIFAISIHSFSFQGFPWISAVIGVTFALYGLMKKYVTIDSVGGVTFETFMLFIPSFVTLFRLEATNQGHYLKASSVDHMLILFSGVATVLPMILFSASVKRLPVSTVGFIQYIAPSLQFLIGAFIFKESLDMGRGISFAIVWVACLILAGAAYKNKEKSSMDGGFA
jgi:chloramphenicol-sensitive protein RarD